MNYIIKPPAACTAEELALFYNLLLERGRIKAQNLALRIGRARLLGFSYEDDELLAIVALKRIRKGNVYKIFNLAGVPEFAPAFRYELGWAFVKETSRRQGLCYTLVEKLLARAHTESENPHQEKIFALVRVENLPAINLLEKFDFKKTGHVYQGREAAFTLFTLI